MNKKLLLFFTLSTGWLAVAPLATRLAAQNYKPITSSKTNRYFMGTDGYVLGIKIIKAEKINNDSIFYNHYSIRDTSSTNSSTQKCPIDPKGASWLGSKILASPNGLFTFFNQHNDSIKIYTQKPINSKWALYKYHNGASIEATFTKVDTQTVLGISDSVKTIVLQAKDSLGNNIPFPFDNKTICISKTHGFTKLFRFYSFPNNTKGMTGSDTTTLNAFSYRPMTLGDAYNFNVGDEFDYDVRYTTGHCYYDDPPPTYLIKTVIAKSFSANTDTVFYTFKEDHYWVMVIWNKPGSPYSLNYESHDIASEKYYPLHQVIYDPFLPTETIDTAIAHYTLSSTNAYNRRLVIYSGNEGYTYKDSCYYPPFEYDTRNVNYIYGCGVLNDIEPMDQINCHIDILLYYKKGTETWGIKPQLPLFINNIVKINNKIVVYPNPTANAIDVAFSLSQPGEYLIYITNLSGTIMAQHQSFESSGTHNYTFDISSLPVGVYFLQIKTNTGISTQKIVKMN